MANLIELAKSYVPMLDEVYKLASCTSDLDGAPELARQGANANELIIPMLEMDGLADYDRNGGYVAGDVKMENRTVQCNFDRGRMFTVDTMDNAETAGLAFGRLAAEFIRTKVVPELDAFRFACYAGKPGISSAEATLSSGADVIAAISAAVTEMDEMRCRPTSATCASPPRCCAPSKTWTATNPEKFWRALRPSSLCPSADSTPPSSS